MEGKFIYVFDEDTRDRLITQGYKLMSSSNGIYIFMNKVNVNFSMNDVHCVYSDTLTF